MVNKYEITAEIEEDVELITNALSIKGRFIVASNELDAQKLSSKKCSQIIKSNKQLNEGFDSSKTLFSTAISANPRLTPGEEFTKNHPFYSRRAGIAGRPLTEVILNAAECGLSLRAVHHFLVRLLARSVMVKESSLIYFWQTNAVSYRHWQNSGIYFMPPLVKEARLQYVY
jgi:hypothetical protein